MLKLTSVTVSNLFEKAEVDVCAFGKASNFRSVTLLWKRPTGIFPAKRTANKGKLGAFCSPDPRHSRTAIISESLLHSRRGRKNFFLCSFFC